MTEVKENIEAAAELTKEQIDEQLAIVAQKNADFLAHIGETDLTAFLRTLPAGSNLTDIEATTAYLLGQMAAYVGCFCNEPYQFLTIITNCARNLNLNAIQMAASFAAHIELQKAAAAEAVSAEVEPGEETVELAQEEQAAE